jgi:putative endonuclease
MIKMLNFIKKYKAKFGQKKYLQYLYGIFGELFAIIILTFKGYVLLNRRYRNRITEIDLIFYKKNTIIFVEVKSRKEVADYHNIVPREQLQKIKKAAEFFMLKKAKFSQYATRFDIFILEKYFNFLHIEGV